MPAAVNKGFTLIETMIVIVIAAILFVAVMPTLSSMPANGLADRIHRDLENDLRYARGRASTAGVIINFVPLNDWQNGWQIKDNDDNIIRERKLDIPTGAVSSTDLDSSKPLVFDPNGRTSAEVSITIKVPECTGLRQRTLMINRIGQILLTGEAKCP
ncbi:GspH/FimT family pseudopilin [Bacterioplanoides pacificum]|uniref:Type II secretion system protein H n=1 Tax=Bacterioplanoides pacificum TaxID=1171596 RepID=A0ABV7VVJ0_9GAMM